MRCAIAIQPGDRAFFRNNAACCAGTGRMGLALHRAYQEQLAQVQQLAGVRHIRSHGLFCDDMGLFQPCTDAEGTEHDAYCFTCLARVTDDDLRLGCGPSWSWASCRRSWPAGSRPSSAGRATAPRPPTLTAGLCW